MLARLKKHYSSGKRILWLVLALVITWHLLWMYGAPPLAILATFLLCALLYLFSGPANAMMVTITLGVFTLFFTLALKITGLDTAMFYRPHEMLEINDGTYGHLYKPNASVTMTQPFSDIQANSGVGIFEPRQVTWITDSLGFRNRRDYHGQQYVLVGDSFVAGESNSQECTLTDQLLNRHGLDTYNLGHPGDGLPDYVSHVLAFRDKYGPNFKAVLFIYEENDFDPYEPSHYKQANAFQRYHDHLKDTAVYRYTRWMYARAFKPTNHEKPLVTQAGQLPFAFLPTYVRVVENDKDLDEATMKWLPVFKELKGQIGHIFFIPGKYRIMAPYLREHPASLPNKQWEYLQKTANAAGIPVTDLTPALAQEEARLAPLGKHIFWQADTHWNCDGLSVAADTTAATLGGKAH